MKKVTGIRGYRFKSKFNIGLIIFGLMLIYIIYVMISYFSTSHVAGYEVLKGSLTETKRYTGIALREEQIVTTENAGYVNYYKAEGTKACYGELVYTIDPSGKLKELLSSENTGISDYSEAELNEVKDSLQEYVSTYSSSDFSTVYDYKSKLLNEIYYMANSRVLNNTDLLSSEGISGQISYGKNHTPGYVVYSTDGFESFTSENITADSFDRSKYSKTNLLNNTYKEAGSDVYKLITSESWSIVIPIDEEEANRLREDSIVSVEFTKTGNSSWATASVFHKDDAYYAELTFNNSVITFAMDRFVEIELDCDPVSGLKIPNSAIKEKQFYLIPLDYVAYTEEDDSYSIWKQTYDDNGTQLMKSYEVEIYNKTDEYYYVLCDAIDLGDTIFKADSQESYVVQSKGTLLGVYNINRAYADFRQITILAQNEEYAIVQPNNTYGLTVYDRIVLDADTVSDDALIYE